MAIMTAPKHTYAVISLNIWTYGNPMEPGLQNKVVKRGVRSRSHAQPPWKHGRYVLVHCRCEAAPNALTFIGAFL